MELNTNGEIAHYEHISPVATMLLKDIPCQYFVFNWEIIQECLDEPMTKTNLSLIIEWSWKRCGKRGNCQLWATMFLKTSFFQLRNHTRVLGGANNDNQLSQSLMDRRQGSDH